MGGVHWLNFLLIRINPSLILVRKITKCLNTDCYRKNCFLNVVNDCLCFNQKCIQNIQIEKYLVERCIKLINWAHTLHVKCITKAHYRWVDCFVTFTVILYVACFVVNKYSIERLWRQGWWGSIILCAIPSAYTPSSYLDLLLRH